MLSSPRDYYGHTRRGRRHDPHHWVRHKLHIVLFSLLLPSVSGSEVLPELTAGSFFSQWQIIGWPLVMTVWGIGLYLLGVRTLSKRGDRWPVGRTVAHVAAMLIFYVSTASGYAAYDTIILSVHMVQHMILSMVVPLALALGAPITLALRTLPGTPRGWLLAVLHSRFAKVLSFPPLTFALYVLSPWALYFTSWYDASLSSVFVHEMMHIHLVTVGALFFWPLMGVDPLPGRVDYPFRVMLIVLTLPFHAFLGVTIMGQDALIGGEHYRELAQGPMGSWLPDLAEDQNLAGGILWGAGDLIGLMFFAVLFTQWVRSSMKEAEREDRRLDRLERLERREEAERQST